MKIRAATADDRSFLAKMLVEACNWAGGDTFTRQHVEAEPQLARYVTGWPAVQDFGVVATDEFDQPVGAAWARSFTTEEPGYGYVGPDVPEVSMAVVPSCRGQGVGRRLLAALLQQARELGWQRVSLSVAVGNRAAHLYRSIGFTAVGHNSTSETMLLDLATARQRT